MVDTDDRTHSILLRAALLAVFTVVILSAAAYWLRPGVLPTASIAAADGAPPGMVRVPAGLFRMGADHSSSAAERPAHEVRVDAFLMDTHHVTRAQFARFVDETGYLTTAERVGYGNVLKQQVRSWVRVRGANWRAPAGTGGDVVARAQHPVVQVSWEDAAAYARWAGKRLPSEAQWEWAARGGLIDADYAWGREEVPGGRFGGNYWQGAFPDRDSGDDGFVQLAPVGRYRPNGYGLYDMAGNAWQWCADWYGPEYYDRREVDHPTGPASGQMRVVRGGSWLSPSATVKVWARAGRRPGESYQHIGFRCVKEVRGM